MNKHPGAFYVPQKVMTQPRTFGSTFNQAGNIRQHETAALMFRHPQIGR